MTNRRARGRKRRAPGWIPTYHGAWAMITVPVIMGALIAGFDWRHLVLFALWWIGFFLFYAASLWLKARRKARYFPPVRAYGLATVPFAVLLAVLAPHLLWWVVAFVPLVALTAGASITRNERSMRNDAITILAASLMLPVAYDLKAGLGRGLAVPREVWTFSGGNGGALTGWPWVWLTTLFVFGYFLGTAFYVKTNIRERDSAVWLWASTMWHAVFLVAAIWLAARGTVHPAHTAVWAALLIRALAVPIYGSRAGWLSAKAIGMGEVVASLAVMVTLLV